MEQGSKHLQQRHHASCIVEIIHIVISTRLEIDQQRSSAANLLNSVQSDDSLQFWMPICNSEQMNNGIGRTPDSLEHCDGIPE
jgi:hypothetical protein